MLGFESLLEDFDFIVQVLHFFYYLLWLLLAFAAFFELLLERIDLFLIFLDLFRNLLMINIKLIIILFLLFLLLFMVCFRLSFVVDNLQVGIFRQPKFKEVLNF